MNRFTSKTQAMNTRKHCWICLTCGHTSMVKIKHCQCGNKMQYFPSAKEARRYKALLLEATYGQIYNLTVQPKYPVIINDKKITTYIADFKYIRGGVEIIEDVKGLETDLFKLKKKLVEAIYGIEITVV